MKIGVAQINSTIGDFQKNINTIINAYHACIDDGAELVVTPELALVGYPPRDLLVKNRFILKGIDALGQLAEHIGEVPILVGYVDMFNFDKPGKPLRNAAAFIQDGEIVYKVWKTLLPSYALFDEQHYFEPGESCEPIPFKGKLLGVTIGEDVWADELLERPLYDRDPVQELKDKGAHVIINLSATPFHIGKPQVKANLLEVVACGTGLPVVYCNAVGGSDQLVFDGHSMFVDPDGNEISDLPGFKECVKVVNAFDKGDAPPSIRDKSIKHIHDSLVLGLHDYWKKSGFGSVCIGIDGGVDSALALAIAVKALGADYVHALSMPSQRTLERDKQLALQICDDLSVRCDVVVIDELFEVANKHMHELLLDDMEDSTQENIRARIRTLLLMSLANKHNYLMLSAGNKSDLSIGNSTIYGDTSGGFAFLSDLPKTLVYELANYVNKNGDWVPKEVLEKKPARKMKLGEVNTNEIPPYEVLDEVLEYYVNYQLSVDEIVQGFGFKEDVVRWIQRRVDLNEWKRQQAAPGLLVTSNAFGFGRCLPINQKFVD